MVETLPAKEVSNGRVKYYGIKILESGEREDSNTLENIRYDVDRLELADEVRVTLTDFDADIALIGYVVQGSQKIVNDALYVDIELVMGGPASEFADGMLTAEIVDGEDPIFKDIGPVIQSEKQEVDYSGEVPVMEYGVINRVIIQ